MYKQAIDVLMSNPNWCDLVREIAKSNPAAVVKAAVALGHTFGDFPTVRALISVDRKIPAIKEYRKITGANLREAKDAVERMMQQ